MTFRDYYKITQPTTKYCFKIAGIIFTFTFTFIWVMKEYSISGSIIEPIKTFIICSLLGNAFGLSILSLAINDGFRQVKRTIHLYNSIPIEIIEQYELKLYTQPLNPKYHYLNLQITSTKPQAPVFIFNKPANPGKVQIIVAIDLRDNDFQSLRHRINKKYRREQIDLTGWGLTITMNWKKSEQLASSELEKNIEKLIAVSQKEDLKIETISAF